MGTNTFHLMMVNVSGEKFRVTYREKIAVKIGEKGINQGFITDEAIERALATIRTFHHEIKAQGVDEIFATATSAIRNAKNGHELIARIEEETGIKARIISGLEEAELIYFGVSKALVIGDEPALIMDIGGGSIEFIIGTTKEILWKQSFELGGQRLLEIFHHHDPIVPEEINALENYLLVKLEELFDACAIHKPKTLIGSSGTFDTLSEIYQRKSGIILNEEMTEYPFSLEAFEKIFHEIIEKKREKRLAIPGMIAMRVDMIVVAAVLIKFIIDSLSISSMRVSAYALKEGVLLKTIEKFNQTGKVLNE